MATATIITPAQAEIISSLTPDDIPAKLRCAICSKLAVSAFRLPCCEQAICESCHAKLPSSCPICEHSPLSAEDCTPHKSLRTTVRVFLRTEEKKREASRPKDITPATPVEATPTPQLPTPEVPTPSAAAAPASAHEHVDSTSANEQADTALPSTESDAGQNAGSAPQPDSSTETQNHPSNGADDGTAEAGESQPPTIKEEGAESADTEKVEEIARADANRQEGDEADQQEQAVSNAAPDFNTMNGAFPNMNFGAAGNMDQMQMMMAMQNGMPAGAFGSFPMMGMPGMGMDPMAMQNMYMNGGFGAQGMGMNMNMGMGGFGGGAPNNNWNSGQQSWNVGQDNFNHPNASGMGNGGDYGSFNSGFQNTGYNQGNYGHANNQFNNYRQNQYGGGGGFRGGRGRGRGFGYGYNARGGYYQNQNGGYVGHGSYQEQQNYIQGGQNYQQGQLNNDQSYNNNGAGVPEGGGDSADEAKTGEQPAVDEFGREIRADEPAANGGEADGTKEASVQPEGSAANAAHDESSYVAPQVNGEHAQGNGTYPGPNGQAGQRMKATGPGSNRGFSQPRDGMQPPPTPAPDVPLNAPKGPKALLRGLPNTSYLTLQARGLVQDDNASRVQVQPQNQNQQHDGYPNTAMANGRSRSSSPGHGDNSRNRDSGDSHRRHRRDRSREQRGSDRDRDYDRGGDYDDHNDRARSRSPSRSRSRDDRRESRRHGRDDDRSQSATVRDDDHDEVEESRSKRRQRRKESSHRGHAAEDLDNTARPDDGENGVDEHRSTSLSPDDAKRASGHHRSSRKDRDGGEKRSSRDKDYDRDRDRDRKHRSSHRDRDYDRRDRDRDRDRDRGDRHRDRDGDRDKERDRRERRRDRDHRSHRSSKRGSAEPTQQPVAEESFNPPSGPRAESGRGLEIKGRSGQEAERRRSSVTAPLVAAQDPHAAEREARNRERLLKEARKMASLAGLTGLAGAKRGRGGDEEGGHGERRSSRRKGRRGEVVSVDEEEERMRRLEAERESARFRDD